MGVYEVEVSHCFFLSLGWIWLMLHVTYEKSSTIAFNAGRLDPTSNYTPAYRSWKRNDTSLKSMHRHKI